MNGMERKQVWLHHVLAVLASMVLITSWSLCGTYAKYVAGASGSATARVAKFEVTQSGEWVQTVSVSGEIAPGEFLDYPVSVNNKSEVTIQYVAHVSNVYSNLPLEFRLLRKGSDGTAESSENQLSAQLAAGDTANLLLRVSWPDAENDASYAGKTDLLQITLEAVQVD